MKILCVDDADFIEFFYKKVLVFHDILVCKDAYQFLIAYEKFGPDLCIVDMHMHNMSGADAIRKIDMETKVVIVSADDLESIGRQAQQLKSEGYNIIGYKSKPILAQELKDLVASATT